MPKKQDANKGQDVAGSSRRRTLRTVVTVAAVGLLALAWLSCLTRDPLDPPNPQIVADAGDVHNYAGIVGSTVAWHLFRWLGVGVYMALLFLTVATALLMLGGSLRDMALRVVGVGLLVASTSTAAAMLWPQGDGITLLGKGGVLGVAGAIFIQGQFGGFSWLLLVLAGLVGLILAADNLVMQVPRLGWRLWRHREQLAQVAAALRGAAVPAPATATGRGGEAEVRTGRAGTRGRLRIPDGVSVPGRVPDPAPEPGEARGGAVSRVLGRARSIGGRIKGLFSHPARPGAAEEPKARRGRRGTLPTEPQVPEAPPMADVPARVEEAPEPQPQSHVPAVVAAAAAPAEAPAAPAPRPLPKLAPRPAPVRRRTAGPDEYVLPSEELLIEAETGYIQSQEAQIQLKRAVLQQTLQDFNVDAQVVGYMTGPVITMFELSLAPGVKVSQISNLANDVARALAAPGVRIVSPLPGKDTIGIEVPNPEKETVRIRQLMNLSPEAADRLRLPLYLGKDAGGDPIVADLASMPHMLIAGTTGSGKSVCINTIIMSLLMTRSPQEVRLILVDPKMVEMAAFENVGHLLCPIVNDMRKAESILEWAATKMDERYEVLKEAGVKNIAQYNKLSPEDLHARFHAETDEEKAQIDLRIPYYVIIIDELADLIMTSSKEVENYIIRIAQKARAVGIHLILATQRPSVNVVTGLIKSNMPCRISFRVASRQESRIVLDQNGAEVLLGQGDMLFLQPGTATLSRAQGTFVDDGEIRGVVGHLRTQGEPVFNQELVSIKPAGLDDEGSNERDELFDKAVEIILQSQRGSVSLLQRRLGIGYSRASRIVDQMAEAGILGDYKGSQARECMMTLDDWFALKASIAADQSGESSLDGEPTSS